MDTKFTPGPYFIKKTKISRNNVHWTVEAEDGPICKVFGPEDLEANANLLKAAPDLLEALQTALWAFDPEAKSRETPEIRSEIAVDTIRAAIAKALGKED